MTGKGCCTYNSNHQTRCCQCGNPNEQFLQHISTKKNKENTRKTPLMPRIIPLKQQETEVPQTFQQPTVSFQ